MRKVNEAYEPVGSGDSAPTSRYIGLVAVGVVIVVSLFWWTRLRS
jgi:hypothetical protein